MPVNISNEELDLFNKNGFSDDDVRATVENYRQQGLNDEAIRQKIDSRLSSWKTPINNTPEQQVKEPNTLVIEGGVKKVDPASFAKSLGKGVVHGVSSIGTGLGKRIANPVREALGKKPLTDYEIENLYGKTLGLPEEGGAYKTGKTVGEIAPYMLLPQTNVAKLGTLGNMSLSGAYQGALGTGVTSVIDKGFDLPENLKDAAIGAATGAAIGGVLGKGGQVIDKSITKRPVKSGQAVGLSRILKNSDELPLETAQTVSATVVPETVVTKLDTPNTVIDNVSDVVNPTKEYKKTQLAQKTKQPQDLQEALQEATPEYEVLHNKDLISQANQNITNNPNALGELQNKVTSANELSALDFETARQAVSRLYQEGRFEEALNLTRQISEKASKSGQAVQALSLWSRTTPEGAVRYGQKIIDEYNQKAKNKIGDLSKEQMEKIHELATNAQATELGTRENAINTQLLMKYLNELVPASKGNQLKTLRNISLLLNPKTFIRNITGNTIFAGMENLITKPVAAAIDKIASGLTGQRTRVLPRIGEYGKGFVQGAKEGAEDVALGINTRDNIGKRFDLANRASFTGDTPLAKLEKALNYSLQVPDRAFYQAAFNESVQNQLAALGTNKVTNEILDRATQEALEAVYQNSSVIGNTVTGLRQGLNRIGTKDFGLGDALVPYAQTPANIVQQSINYSPLGLAKSINNFRLGDQRQATLDAARALVGSGLMGAGYAGVKNGIINPSIDDYEIAKNYEALGVRPDTINLPNGTNVSYTQLQPLAAPVTAGAAIADLQAGNPLQALDRSLGTIADLSMLQGVNNFVGDLRQNGLATATVNQIGSLPSQFVPTALNQINAFVDPYSRETYDPNPLKRGINKAINRIPGLSQNLPMRYDVQGQPLMKYQSEGAQKAYDVLVNPLFTNQRVDNPNMGKLINLYEQTGDKGALLPVADRSVRYKDLQGNKVNKQLSGEELSQYQQQLGTVNNDVLSNILNSNLYNNLDDEQKLNLINSVKRSVKGYVDEQLFDKPNPQKRSLIRQLTQEERDKIIKEVMTDYKKYILPKQIKQSYENNFAN